jgi:hypothetical protein
VEAASAPTGTAGSRKNAAVPSGSGNAQRGYAAADREDRVVAVDGDPQQGEGDERAERVGGVHGAVHSERPSPVTGPGGRRDHRVAGCEEGR